MCTHTHTHSQTHISVALIFLYILLKDQHWMGKCPPLNQNQINQPVTSKMRSEHFPSECSHHTCSLYVAWKWLVQAPLKSLNVSHEYAKENLLRFFPHKPKKSIKVWKPDDNHWFIFLYQSYYFLKEILIASPQHHFTLVHEWEVQCSGMLGSV